MGRKMRYTEERQRQIVIAMGKDKFLKHQINRKCGLETNQSENDFRQLIQKGLAIFDTDCRPTQDYYPKRKIIGVYVLTDKGLRYRRQLIEKKRMESVNDSK